MKPWWKSKTIWVNLLGIIGFIIVQQFNIYSVQQWTAISLGVLSIINILLRIDTDTPIGGGKK